MQDRARLPTVLTDISCLPHETLIDFSYTVAAASDSPLMVSDVAKPRSVWVSRRGLDSCVLTNSLEGSKLKNFYSN